MIFSQLSISFVEVGDKVHILYVSRCQYWTCLFELCVLTSPVVCWHLFNDDIWQMYDISAAGGCYSLSCPDYFICYEHIMNERVKNDFCMRLGIIVSIQTELSVWHFPSKKWHPFDCYSNFVYWQLTSVIFCTNIFIYCKKLASSK